MHKYKIFFFINNNDKSCNWLFEYFYSPVTLCQTYTSMMPMHIEMHIILSICSAYIWSICNELVQKITRWSLPVASPWVWSLDGPVPWVDVFPELRIQSKSSLYRSLIHPHIVWSKLQLPAQGQLFKVILNRKSKV